MSGKTKETEQGRTVEASRLHEVRLRVDPRFATEDIVAAFNKRRVPAAAAWLRDHGATRLLDLKVFPPSAAGTGWHGRASVTAADATKLLENSGDLGVIVSPAKRTGHPCWLPPGATLETAVDLAVKYDGRIIANRVGLGVCVADFDNARPLYLEALGQDAGLKGCPTFEITIDAGLNPHDFGDVVAERRAKNGKRRVWLRIDHPKDATHAPTFKVPVPPADQPAGLDMDLDTNAESTPTTYSEITGAQALPPRKPTYASVARARKRRNNRSTNAAYGVSAPQDVRMTDAATTDAAEAADFFGVEAPATTAVPAPNAPTQSNTPAPPKGGKGGKKGGKSAPTASYDPLSASRGGKGAKGAPSDEVTRLRQDKARLEARLDEMQASMAKMAAAMIALQAQLAQQTAVIAQFQPAPAPGAANTLHAPSTPQANNTRMGDDDKTPARTTTGTRRTPAKTTAASQSTATKKKKTKPSQ